MHAWEGENLVIDRHLRQTFSTDFHALIPVVTFGLVIGLRRNEHRLAR